ncbi:MAG: M15 family metallopeptidase [Fibrobacterota bacterium]|nr:MAG: M15 family metallopeptidase [Fibrobacterota bacterium]
MNPLLLPILLALRIAAVADPPTVDCQLERDSAIGRATSASLAATLDVRVVGYVGFDGKRHIGQIVCEKSVCQELVTWFAKMETVGFPFRSVCPISKFGGSDSASMAADNSYCFANRGIWGSREPSWHAQGRALDINPQENPAFKRGRVIPSTGRQRPGTPGTLSDTSIAVKSLRAIGWKWGAHWRRVQDWQHFQKVR